MSSTPTLTLHVLPPSHPCKAVEAALKLKGLEYERVVITSVPHTAEMEGIYGEGNGTVPGMLVDDEPVHGSRPILAKLDELVPDPPLYPDERADAVRAAEKWGEDEFQDLGRHLSWGSLYFRPEAMGTIGGAGTLDPAGTDFAIKYVRATWRYHGITAQLLADDLAGLPAKLDHIDSLAADGVINGESPTAADLQIGSTMRVLLLIGDLRPLVEGRAGEEIALRWFPDYPGEIPAGAFPAGWVPARS